MPFCAHRYLSNWNQWGRLRLDLLEEPILECIAINCHSLLCSAFVKLSTFLLPMVAAIPNFVWLSVILLCSSKQSLCVHFLVYSNIRFVFTAYSHYLTDYVWNTIAEKVVILYVDYIRICNCNVSVGWRLRLNGDVFTGNDWKCKKKAIFHIQRCVLIFIACCVSPGRVTNSNDKCSLQT